MELSIGKMDTFDEIFDSGYFHHVKRLLTIIGAWPYQTRRTKIFLRSCFLLFGYLYMSPMVRCCIKKYDSEDVMAYAECVLGSIVSIQVIIMPYLIILRNDDQVKKLCNTIAESWILITNDAENQILKDFAKEGRIIYRILEAFIIFLLTLLNVVPPVIKTVIPLIINQSQERRMVIKGDYYIDQHEYYYQLCAIHTILACLCSPIMFGSVSFIVMAVHQNFAFFRIVRYADTIHDMTSALVFWFMGISVGEISFLTAWILETDNFELFFKCTLIIISLLFILLLISWPGQQIIEYSTDIYSCVYDCDWYLMSKENKKLFQIIMMRSLKPSVLTAGGLYILNYENFGKVLKTIASYVAVMRFTITHLRETEEPIKEYST